jgi:hypothetical protein
MADGGDVAAAPPRRPGGEGCELGRDQSAPEQRLVDGSGKDQLIGGAGADTFALTAADFRLDIIYDFSGAGGDSEVIDLDAFGAKASESVSYDPKPAEPEPNRMM